MERQALEYLVDLGESKVFRERYYGGDYTNQKLYRIEEPKAETLNARTLTSAVDYIKANVDIIGLVLVHIESPTLITLKSPLNNDKRREVYMECTALTPNNISFNRFSGTEEFNIMLQSSFVDNKDRNLLLKVTGNVKDEAVKSVGDNGVSQAVTIKTGVASVSDVVVPNPVTLAPFRTFQEVEQPESKFIFRMKDGPSAALYEADGGAWRNEAMKNIKEFFKEQLKGFDNVSIIS